MANWYPITLSLSRKFRKINKREPFCAAQLRRTGIPPASIYYSMPKIMSRIVGHRHKRYPDQITTHSNWHELGLEAACLFLFFVRLLFSRPNAWRWWSFAPWLRRAVAPFFFTLHALNYSPSHLSFFRRACSDAVAGCGPQDSANQIRTEIGTNTTNSCLQSHYLCCSRVPRTSAWLSVSVSFGLDRRTHKHGQNAKRPSPAGKPAPQSNARRRPTMVTITSGADKRSSRSLLSQRGVWMFVRNV